MLLNLYIFNKKGACLYYHEWERPYNPLAGSGDEDAKLMFGLLFSLKQLAQQLATVPAERVSSFTTENFTLHQLETATGLKLVLNTSKSTGKGQEERQAQAQACLLHIYSQIFVTYVTRNPLWVPGSTVTCPLFVKKLTEFMAEQRKKGVL